MHPWGGDHFEEHRALLAGLARTREQRSGYSFYAQRSEVIELAQLDPSAWSWLRPRRPGRAWNSIPGQETPPVRLVDEPARITGRLARHGANLELSHLRPLRRQGVAGGLLGPARCARRTASPSSRTANCCWCPSTSRSAPAGSRCWCSTPGWRSPRPTSRPSPHSSTRRCAGWSRSRPTPTSSCRRRARHSWWLRVEVRARPRHPPGLGDPLPDRGSRSTTSTLYATGQQAFRDRAAEQALLDAAARPGRGRPWRPRRPPPDGRARPSPAGRPPTSPPTGSSGSASSAWSSRSPGEAQSTTGWPPRPRWCSWPSPTPRAPTGSTSRSPSASRASRWSTASCSRRWPPARPT